MEISKSYSRTDAAYDALAQAIYDGTFAPGSFIRIDQLARTLDISIAPTREAMARAAAQRLLVHDANRGFIVAPTLTPDEYSSLFSTRLLLEEQAIRNPAAPQRLASALQPHADRMRDYRGGPHFKDFMPYSLADRAFHRTLVEGAENPFLLIAWESLHFHLHVSRLYAGQGVTDHAPGDDEHQAIVDALRDGDVDRAHDVLLTHVRGAETRLRPLVGD